MRNDCVQEEGSVSSSEQFRDVAQIPRTIDGK